MRVFAGKQHPSMWQASHSRLDFRRGDFSPSLGTDRRTEWVRCQTRDLDMHSAKAIKSARAIATLVSVAAIAGSMFAASWVGLALLGF
jgi:hypothetical protein